MQINPLAVFIIKVFLCLPLCYWGWYYFADLTTWIVISVAEPLLQSLFPKLIIGIEQSGYLLEVIAEVTVPAQNLPRDMVAELPIPVNPLIYSYGLPLGLALILASPFSFFRTLSAIFISLFLFLLIQVWGISFESTKVLFLQTPPELIGNMILPSWQRDCIALGYQFGVLILPVVTPIVIWVVFYQDFIVQFTPALFRKSRP